MITNYSSEIKIAIFHSVTERQMDDDRQISAELQHNFHVLPLFNSKTNGPIFTICREIRYTSAIKPPKLIGYNNSVPLTTAKLM